jgi:hypothetical protein
MYWAMFRSSLVALESGRSGHDPIADEVAVGHFPRMSNPIAIKVASTLLIVVATGGGLAATLLAVLSVLFIYTHVTADKFSADPVAWALNPALWLTPVLFGGAGWLAVRAAKRTLPRDLVHSIAICLVAIAIMWSYVRFDPLVEVDSCFDAGGVWRNDRCSR